MEWDELVEGVLREVRPSPEEVEETLGFARWAAGEVNRVLGEAGVAARAEVHGSVAHGTWLRGQKDVDVFIVLESGGLEEALDAVRRGLPWRFREAYAEHPYLEAEVAGFTLDLVPCYAYEGGEPKSATDRSPLHTRWLKGRLEGLEEDVLVLKKMLRALGIYGAEIRVGGFSGYLCELLVVYYGGFRPLVEAASRWRRGVRLSFQGEAPEFPQPLTVVDPVDPGRNVASAVSLESFATFVAACQSLLEDPRPVFFREPPEEAPVEQVLALLEGRATQVVFLAVGDEEPEVADVLWGQLHRSRRAMERYLGGKGFHVLRSGAWSDGVGLHVLVWEAAEDRLQGARLHKGPPVYMREDSRRFLEAHGGGGAVAGPFIQGDRWCVVLRREPLDLRGCVESALVDGGVGVGFSKGLAERVARDRRVLLGVEVKPLLQGGFTGFLLRWLRGRPVWLE